MIHHTLVLGVTGSGKTTLARAMAKEALRQKRPVLVYTRVPEDWPQGCQVFTEFDPFEKKFWESSNVVAFFDEGAETMGRYDADRLSMVTRGRHQNNQCWVLAHQASQIAPVVRGQCSRLFLFQQGAKNSKILSEEWCTDLSEAPRLGVGEFLFVERFRDSVEKPKRQKLELRKEGKK